MSDIQTTREHDKDMLIAGFRHDLAKARAEIERLKAALHVIERRTSPGNRTFDECLRDMGFANDYARAALEGK